ncbi:MAG: RNA polymerase factor sigma-54 [Alysiella sp.]|uniref:RNA polymerase factor sigma-54 n=1 Tax=Alysiella sp. TaxID=1872483 RepID=UPI0026DB20E8|nr:RNA polymerase factor sigma-54 [Alysiella sp.]MDO4434161.1 RNA polymerase factor sigma-54 [Alysiella sp.]
MSSNNFQLKLKQTQQLSQNMQQSLRVLQMSGLEIEREVEDWLAENPILERKELPENHEYNAVTSISKRHISLDDDDSSAWENLAHEETLNDYLHKQVCEHPLNETEAAHVHILIDFLDEQGYLTESIEQIIEHTPLEWMLDEEDMEIALENLRRFDPPGIATTNLSQSLLHQLDRLPSTPIRRLAAQIVVRHLDEITQNPAKNLAKLGRLLPESTENERREALEMIASLNPYPAYGFASSEPTAYIKPDVFVEKGRKDWEVYSNEEAWPQLQISPDLSDALQDNVAQDPIWREHLNAAKQKIDMLQQRKSTVMRVAEYILNKQTDFFIFGEIGMSPMLIKDCAKELELAESTISRAVNGKYLSCPQGLFPLRYFFSQNAVGNNDEADGISANAIRSIITHLIANEDKQNPLSDSALHDLLLQQGINIARRTVAKYREQLGLAAALQRKNS